jgi:hypothetical protein
VLAVRGAAAAAAAANQSVTNSPLRRTEYNKIAAPCSLC